MTLLPFVNQFLIPTFVSLYILVSTLFPHTATIAIQQKTKVIHRENSVIKSTVHPSPTEAPSSSSQSTDNSSSKSDSVIADTKIPIGNSDANGAMATPTLSPSNTTNPDVMSTVTPPVTQTITAKTSLSTSGKQIYLTMQYPSGGGAITGNMSGDCNGTISGIYDGPVAKTLSGKGSATCPMGFISVPVDITYSGKLTTATNAQITYTVNALGKSETGTTGLSLTQ